MSSSSTNASRFVAVVGMIAIAACTHVAPNTAASGTRVGQCTAEQMMVFENHSGYNAEIWAGDGNINGVKHSSIKLGELPSGTADTIRSTAGANRSVGVNIIDRPKLPSGEFVRISGISQRCVART